MQFGSRKGYWLSVIKTQWRMQLKQTDAGLAKCTIHVIAQASAILHTPTINADTNTDWYAAGPRLLATDNLRANRQSICKKISPGHLPAIALQETLV